MNIKLIPLDRVEINDEIISLGMKKENVEKMIGSGELIGKRNYYYHSEMAIDYDSDDKVEFIEFLGGMQGILRPMIYGVSAFDYEADKLVEILTMNNNGEVDDKELGYSFAFLNISVGVYRETTLSDILEMIDDMKASGISVEDNEELELEKERANHWATIGIGVDGYYR